MYVRTYVHTLHPMPGLNSQPRVHESYTLLNEPASCLWPSSISLIKAKFFPTFGFCICYSLSSLCLANSTSRSWVKSNSHKGVSLNPINLGHHCSSSKHSSFSLYRAPLFLFHIVPAHHWTVSSLYPLRKHMCFVNLYMYTQSISQYLAPLALTK